MNTFSETAAAAASLALSKVGCPYSQAKRTQLGIYDCSSLVARVYTAQGKKWKYGGSVPISCNEVYDDDFELLWPAAYADIGRKLGGKDVIAMATLPGDVQYLCTDSGTKRTNRITHVAMVADKSRIVHARGTRYGVVTSPINLYAGKVCAVVRYNPACTLRIGMKGWRTLALQKALVARGYNVSPDGEFGSKTKEAVSAFQRSYGLPATGEANHETQKSLGLVSAQPAPSDNPAFGTSAVRQVVVIGSTVNLRAGPGTNYLISRLVHSGDVLDAVDPEQWTPVMLNGKVLWISARHARALDSQTA